MNPDSANLGIWIFLAALALILGPLFALRRTIGASAPPPMPEDWQTRLNALPHARLLDAAQRQRWHADVAQFWASKRFVGCADFWVNAEVRLTIAGYACLLLVNSPPGPPYPRLKTVLVYPQAFLVSHTEPDEFGLVPDDPVEQIGESWDGERVILSWADVEAALVGDEVNVVVHEFAHQLDDQSEDASGAPPWRDRQRWATVMSEEFSRLRRHRRPRVLDPYGRESPEEFFGVVMEAYFQRGTELALHHPSLYALLVDTFGLKTDAALFVKHPPTDTANP